MTRASRRRGPVTLAGILLAFLGAGIAGGSARADIWRFYGGAGVNAGRTDNPQNSDPNAPASERRGSVAVSLRATGGVAATWARTDFDFAWSPQTVWYEKDADLNAVSHNVASSWKHAWSPASSLELTEALQYTPEELVDPNSLAQNNVITERNRRTNSNFRGNYTLQAGRATTLAWRYTWLERAYSADQYIDSSDHTAAFEWRRRLPKGHSIFTGYNYGIFSFKSAQPGSDRHAANAGWGYATAGGFTLNLATGYNILLPDDPDVDSSSGLNLNANIGYNGPNVTLTAGHLRGITDGGGVYANAENINTHGDVRMTFNRLLSGDLSYSYNVNERIQTTVTQQATDETLRSQSGRAQLNWTLGQQWSANASYTRFVQSVASAAATTPAQDVRTNRYAIGLTWSTR